MLAGWLTVTCNGIPVQHFGPASKHLAERYGTDPEYRQNRVINSQTAVRAVWLSSATYTLLVNQIVGGPATPAFCIALLSSSLLTKACAASTVAKSWVTVMSLGLSAAWYTA